MKGLKPPKLQVSIPELAILMACIVAPFFILANEANGMLFVKGASGVALVVVVGSFMAGYHLWTWKS